MGISSGDSVEFITKDIRETVREAVKGAISCLVLLGGLVLLTGCPPDEAKTKPAPVAPAPTPGSTGESSEPKITVDDSQSVFFNENEDARLVPLLYKKDQGGVVPTACSVDSPLMVTAKSCTCSEGGACNAVIQPLPGAFGDGSFEFTLTGRSGLKGISSDVGRVSVEIREVTLTISAGDNQEGPAGNALVESIEVLLQNSEKEPISGVDIFWDVKKIVYVPSGGDGDEKSWRGKVNTINIGDVVNSDDIDNDGEYKKTKTDEHGKARCKWKLGTRIPVGMSQAVNVSAFHKGEAIYKETLSVSFSASVKPGTATKLAFWSQGYQALGSPRLYRGPTTPAWAGTPPVPRLHNKPERAGVTLGMDVSGPGERGRYELWAFAQDGYGNSAVIEEPVNVELGLTTATATAATFLPGGNNSAKLVVENLEHSGKRWRQSLARFKDLQINEKGEYFFSAVVTPSPDPALTGDGGSFGGDAKFEVISGVPYKLSFDKQPEAPAETAGQSFSKQPKVSVRDARENILSSFDGSISLVAEGVGGGTLSGKTTLLPTDRKGEISFSGLFIDKPGQYRLIASSKGLVSVKSDPFPITGTVPDPSVSVTFNENGPEETIDLPLLSGEALPFCEVSTAPRLLDVTVPCTCTTVALTTILCQARVQPKAGAVGVESFSFRVVGSGGSHSEKTVRVEILPVTMSIVSGNGQNGEGQHGTVGEKLAPLVVAVRNSKNVPISGAKVFGDVEGRNEHWLDGNSEVSCPETTDTYGFATCNWTLGTKIPIGVNRRVVNVSAFNKYEGLYKKALSASFSATVRPGPATKLAFWSQGYEDGARMYYGPTSPQRLARPVGGKYETAGVSLGEEVGGPGKYELWVFSQDRYGNATTVGDGGVDVTLSLGKTKPEGAVFLGTAKSLMTNEILVNGETRWTQGRARFDNVKFDKAGEYLLSATASGGGLSLASSDDDNQDFGAVFNVNPGAATKLDFITQPEGGTAGAVWSSSPVVAVQDKFGNTVTSHKNSSKAQIGLAITGTGSKGARLSAGAAGAVSGMATFPRLRIDKVGVGYRLTAKTTGLTPAISNTFNIKQ